MMRFGSIQAEIGRAACPAKESGMVGGQKMLEGVLVLLVHVDELDAAVAFAGGFAGRDMGDFSSEGDGVVADMQRDVVGRPCQKTAKGGNYEANAATADIADPVDVTIDFGADSIIVENGFTIVLADDFFKIGVRRFGAYWSDR